MLDNEIYRDGSLVIKAEYIGGMFYGFVLYDENLLDEMGEPMVLCVAETPFVAFDAIAELELVD